MEIKKLLTYIRFVSRAGQCLSWNRAVLNCVQETGTRKKLVLQIDRHTCKVLVQDDLHFLSVCRRHDMTLSLALNLTSYDQYI